MSELCKPASRSFVSAIKCTNISLIRIAFEKSNCATANKNQNKLQNSRKKKRNQLNNYYFYYTRILFLSFTIMQTQTAKKKKRHKNYNEIFALIEGPWNQSRLKILAETRGQAQSISPQQPLSCPSSSCPFTAHISFSIGPVHKLFQSTPTPSQRRKNCTKNKENNNNKTKNIFVYNDMQLSRCKSTRIAVCSQSVISSVGQSVRSSVSQLFSR